MVKNRSELVYVTVRWRDSRSHDDRVKTRRQARVLATSPTRVAIILKFKYLKQWFIGEASRGRYFIRPAGKKRENGNT